MKQDRLNKIDSALMEVASYVVFTKSAEIQSDFGLITVNKVELSSDGTYADIFVSSIKNKENLCKTLALYAQDVKEAINKKMALRVTPRVRFRYDDTMETSTEMMKKIDSLDIK